MPASRLGTTGRFTGVAKNKNMSTLGFLEMLTPKGGALQLKHFEEEVTLSTGATTTTLTNTLPVGTVAVWGTVRVTTTITTAINYQIGDGSDANRYVLLTTDVTAGDSAYAVDHVPAAITAAVTPTITTNVNPGAGAVRVSLYYLVAVPPTS